MKICKSKVKYKDRWGLCPTYNDCRCCVGCDQYECKKECDSAWFYVDCDCHHATMEVIMEKDKIIQEMIGMYNRCGNSTEVAEKFGVSASTVRRKIRKYVTFKSNKRISEEVKQKVYEDYKMGMTNVEISENNNISRATVKSILSRFGVLSSDKYIHLVDSFVQDYERGDSTPVIAKRYGISNQTVLEHLYYSKVEIRDASKNQRKYPIQDDYFKTLNDEKIYELGLIFSMGSISRRDYSSDSLDLAVLEKYKHLIVRAIKNISPRKEEEIKVSKDGTCKVRICSNELCSDLTKFGIKKKIPQFNSEQQKIFFKGYFKYCLSVRKAGVYISYNRIETDELFQYLESLGVELNELVYERYGVLISQQVQIERLARCHTEILDMIEEYVKKNSWNTKWSSFIIRFREVLF